MSSASIRLAMLAWAVVLGGTGVAAAEPVTRLDRVLLRPTIEIWKGARVLELRDGGAVVRKFPIVLGLVPLGAKRHQGDLRTPEGRYYVSDKKASSRFRRFLGISYPNLDDAERGYMDRLITANEWGDLFFAQARREIPRSDTRLGGRVGIHGYGGRPEVPIDWTQGCIAVTDAEIDYLYAVVPLGTPVVIHD